MKGVNDLGMSLVSIFVPIYLLELGYSFQTVIIYLIIHHSVLLVSAFLSVYVSNKIGLVNTLHIRFGLLTVFLILLHMLSDHPTLLYIIPVIGGMEAAFFWEPVNILFIRSADKKTMGSAFSKFIAYPKMLSLFAPLIGAGIIAFWSFNVLFVVALIIILLGIIPLLSVQIEKTDFQFTWKRTREIYEKNKKFVVPEIIDNLAEDAVVLWSIFIFIQLDNVVHIGAIGTLLSVASIIFTLSFGKLTDKANKYRLIKIGAMLVVISWILHFTAAETSTSFIVFYIVSLVGAFSFKIFNIPYSSFLYSQAQKDDAQFIILREIPTVLGRLVLFGIALLVGEQIPLLFLFVAIVFSFFIFYNFKRNVSTPSAKSPLPRRAS